MRGLREAGAAAVLAALLPLLSAWADEGGCEVFAHVNPEFESAHVSMGKLKAAYPVFNLDFGAGLGLGDLGYVFAGCWTESDLSNHYRDRRHQVMQEVDPIVGCGRTASFAEGWSLDSRLATQWNLMTGYYGRARRSYDEWQFRETLVTPWLTAWYGMRNFYLPVAKASFCAGVTRRFPLWGSLSLAPAVWVDGGSDRWNEQRFGCTERRGRIGRGVNSCSVRLMLQYALSEDIDLYGGVTGVFVVDGDMRRELDASAAREAKSDVVIVSAGLKWRI
ncbi:MAG: hypothetical protein IJ829_03770 [Kiritimatiellae bacterium]|nr:hypothetical protein [Kiritimatiellia bacterium]